MAVIRFMIQAPGCELNLSYQQTPTIKQSYFWCSQLQTALSIVRWSLHRTLGPREPLSEV